MTGTERIEQDGCRNCKHCLWLYHSWHEIEMWFCTLGSAAIPADEFASEFNAWAEDREVNPWTICGAHRKKP